jgi:DNA-binding GntR family transcriptional regulator
VANCFSFSGHDVDEDETPPSLYENLRRDIISGRIRPNERLIEADLASFYHVSRTPVREALQRLFENKLIVRIKSGWVVREYSLKEIKEIYEVRAALEGFAARLAAERATDQELEDIQRNHLDYIEFLSNVEIDPLILHNDVFHELVIKAAHNQHLADQITAVSRYHFSHRMSLFMDEEDVRTSISGHHELVNALMRRKPDESTKAAITGVLTGLDKILERLILVGSERNSPPPVIGESRRVSWTLNHF